MLLDRMTVTAESSKEKRVRTKANLSNASITDFRSMTLASIVVVFLLSSTSYLVINTQHKKKRYMIYDKFTTPAGNGIIFFNLEKKLTLLVNPRT